MSTIKVSNLQNASAASPAIVLDANSRATLNGLSYPTEGSLSGRNRIINGDMRIDQRNAGASVTPTSNAFVLDRWIAGMTQASKYSVQQNAAAVTTPSRFTNYLGVTSASAYSITSSDAFYIEQRIEGFNVSDLDWGRATAASVTLSFWIRSSLTGTFGGALRNSGNTRSYPFSYTINAANTWEYKTVAISGDTAGTWLTDSGLGISCVFGIGVGSTYSATAGSWAGSNLLSATGATSVVGTNGATFYITGVQLEAGSVATPFERRSYGQELALCQRYYQQGKAWGYVLNDSATNAAQGGGSCVNFSTQMRAAPTITSFSGSAFTALNIDLNGFGFQNTGGQNANVTINATYAAAAEL